MFKKKRKKSLATTYIRKEEKYPAEEILPQLAEYAGSVGLYKTKRVDIDGDLINIRSIRLETFRKSLVCACCGLEGKYFVKEKHRSGDLDQKEYYHLNLYASANGNEVLMTSDHIMPKALGGRKSSRGNRQTLCIKCNQLKGKRDVTNEELLAEIKRAS